MPKLNNNKKIIKKTKPRLGSQPKKVVNKNNTMKKESIFPLVSGLILGILLMLLWQLGAGLRNQSIRLAQLEEATINNSQGVNEIVNFINQNMIPDSGAGEIAE